MSEQVAQISIAKTRTN